jgi:hypothetical protein
MNGDLMRVRAGGNDEGEDKASAHRCGRFEVTFIPSGRASGNACRLITSVVNGLVEL